MHATEQMNNHSLRVHLDGQTTPGTLFTSEFKSAAADVLDVAFSSDTGDDFDAAAGVVLVDCGPEVGFGLAVIDYTPGAILIVPSIDGMTVDTLADTLEEIKEDAEDGMHDESHTILYYNPGTREAMRQQ